MYLPGYLSNTCKAAQWIAYLESQHMSNACRRRRGEAVLGQSVVALHASQLAQPQRATARFWQWLGRQAQHMDDVRWWREGSERLRASAEVRWCF